MAGNVGQALEEFNAPVIGGLTLEERGWLATARKENVAPEGIELEKDAKEEEGWFEIFRITDVREKSRFRAFVAKRKGLGNYQHRPQRITDVCEKSRFRVAKRKRPGNHQPQATHTAPPAVTKQTSTGSEMVAEPEEGQKALPAHEYAMKSKLLALLSNPPSSGAAAPLNVLVYGDSWGAMGPSWTTLEGMFADRGVRATVKSVAVGRTTACGMSERPRSLELRATEQFGDDDVDFVWFTLGGNDLATNAEYRSCGLEASTFDEFMHCVRDVTEKIIKCSDVLLSHLWEKHPKAQVMQCGYDIPCLDGACSKTISSFAPFCGADNITCHIRTFKLWQPLLLEPLERKYPDKYTGINILGTVQAAGGVEGASVGNPVDDVGSPCALIDTCIHPKAGKAGAKAIGNALWDAYFEEKIAGLSAATPVATAVLPKSFLIAAAFMFLLLVALAVKRFQGKTSNKWLKLQTKKQVPTNMANTLKVA